MISFRYKKRGIELNGIMYVAYIKPSNRTELVMNDPNAYCEEPRWHDDVQSIPMQLLFLHAQPFLTSLLPCSTVLDRHLTVFLCGTNTTFYGRMASIIDASHVDENERVDGNDQ